ncbi:MAG: hypothetical protein AAF928_14920 [Myxococcota bacterium]
MSARYPDVGGLYELWSLGEEREQDVRLDTFARLTEAVRALDARRATDETFLLELRCDGVRVDINDGVPVHRRSTRPTMSAFAIPLAGADT